MNFDIRSTPVASSWKPGSNNWTQEAVDDLRKMADNWFAGDRKLKWEQHHLFNHVPGVGWVLFPEKSYNESCRLLL